MLASFFTEWFAPAFMATIAGFGLIQLIRLKIQSWQAIGEFFRNPHGLRDAPQIEPLDFHDLGMNDREIL